MLSGENLYDFFTRIERCIDWRSKGLLTADEFESEIRAALAFEPTPMWPIHIRIEREPVRVAACALTNLVEYLIDPKVFGELCGLSFEDVLAAADEACEGLHRALQESDWA